jgi:hypothetical protein
MPDVSEIKNLNIDEPSNRQFQALADKQKREMGGTFDQVFSPEAYGEGVRRMQRKRANLDALMSRLKPRPWTVVNLMPFPLNVNGVLHSHLAGKDNNQVPACPVGESYAFRVISDVLYSIKDEGAGMDNLDNYNPEPWDPSLLAKDFEHEFVTRMGCGGVFAYEGGEEPKNCGKMADVEKARKERNQWLLRKVQEAEAEWSDTSGAGRKNITELHRKAAEVLLHEKVLKNQPAWLLATNADAEKTAQLCPGCGEASEPGAAICKHCRYVFDPLKAYKSTLIGYGHIAMDRLTPQQWQEANQIKAEREKNKKHGQKDEPAAQSSAPSPSVEANGEKKPIADQPGSSTPA